MYTRLKLRNFIKTDVWLGIDNEPVMIPKGEIITI